MRYFLVKGTDVQESGLEDGFLVYRDNEDLKEDDEVIEVQEKAIHFGSSFEMKKDELVAISDEDGEKMDKAISEEDEDMQDKIVSKYGIK